MMGEIGIIVGVSAALSVIVSLIVSGIIGAYKRWELQKRVEVLEEEAYTLRQKIAGRIGNIRKKEKKEEVEAAIAEASALLSSGEQPDLKKLMGIALKYPSAIDELMKIIKKEG